MEQILKDFIDNNEATDAYITSKVTYISLEDVDSLLKKQKQALTIPVVVGQSEQLNTAWKALEWVGFERGNEFDDEDITEMLGI
jgi:hypothetical protein